MAVNFDLTTDGDHFDGLESVTVRSPDLAATTTVTKALRRRVTSREAAAAGGKYTEADVKWHLPAVQLATPPEMGSTITDGDGNVWTVLAVDRDTFDSRWRCWTRELAVQAGLNETISIQQATWSKTPSGAPVAVWQTYRASLRARIQPLAGHVEVEHDRRQARVTHKVYLAEQIPLDDNFRIVSDGVVYNVVSYESPERIDQLPIVNVEQVPWPLS